MCSFSVENSANIHAAFDLFYRFWLVDRKSLHQPYELLTAKISDLLLVAGPAEPSAFKSFVEQQKTVALPKQCFQTVSSSSAEQKQAILKIIKDELNYDHGYNLDVWCLALCDSFNPNFGVSRDSIKTYWPVSVEGWKNESDCLTNMIINWDKGYTSYLKVFECKKALDVIVKIIETNDSVSDRDSSLQFKMPKISNYYCAIKDTNKLYTSVIRMYTKTSCPEETIIVPYVFIHKVSKETIKDVYVALKEAFHIGDIPKCFINADINNDVALQFYKWLTYKASEKLLKKYNSFMSLDVKEIKTVFNYIDLIWHLLH